MKLSLKPNDPKFQGKTSYFDLILKEKGTDLPELTNTIHCFVNVAGEIIEAGSMNNFTDVKFKMTEISNHSTAQLTFSNPLNLTFISENFMDIFDIKVKNNTFREHKTWMPVLDAKVEWMHPNMSQLNFSMTFSEPYLLGLLKKMPDKVQVKFRGAELLTTDGIISNEYYGGHFRNMILKPNDPD